MNVGVCFTRVNLAFINPDRTLVTVAIIHREDSRTMSLRGVVVSQSYGRVRIVYTKVLRRAATSPRFTILVLIAPIFTRSRAKLYCCLVSALVWLYLVIETQANIFGVWQVNKHILCRDCICAEVLPIVLILLPFALGPASELNISIEATAVVWRPTLIFVQVRHKIVIKGFRGF